MSQSENNIINDLFDSNTYDKVYEATEKLKETTKLGTKSLSTFNRLIQDIYYGVYKYLPTLFDENKVSPDYLGNRQFVQEAMNLPEFNKLRTFTKLKKFESALASITLGNMILENFKEELEEQEKQIKKMNENQKDLNKMKDELEGVDFALEKDPNNKKLQKFKSDLMAGVAKLKEAQKQATKQLKAIQEKQKKVIYNKMKQALHKSIEDIQETANVLSWGSQLGTEQYLTFEEKLELANVIRNSNKILKISKLLGKLQFLAINKYKTTVRKIPTEIHSITQGNKLNYLIPSELIKLTDENLKPLFFKGFIERSLLQYDLKGKEEEGKGDIVICIDTSGSMRGTPEIWSKAMALAVTEIAYRQNRNVAILFFNNQVTKRVVFEKNDRKKLKKFVEVAQFFSGGGTSYEPPLREARKHINTKEFKNADILFITDNICQIDNKFLADFLKFKEEKEVKIISLLIYEWQTERSTVDKFSDKVIATTELTEELSEEIFEGLI